MPVAAGSVRGVDGAGRTEGRRGRWGRALSTKVVWRRGRGLEGSEQTPEGGRCCPSPAFTPTPPPVFRLAGFVVPKPPAGSLLRKCGALSSRFEPGHLHPETPALSSRSAGTVRPRRGHCSRSAPKVQLSWAWETRSAVSTAGAQRGSSPWAGRDGALSPEQGGVGSGEAARSAETSHHWQVLSVGLTTRTTAAPAPVPRYEAPPYPWRAALPPGLRSSRSSVRGGDVYLQHQPPARARHPLPPGLTLAPRAVRPLAKPALAGAGAHGLGVRAPRSAAQLPRCPVSCSTI